MLFINKQGVLYTYCAPKKKVTNENAVIHAITIGRISGVIKDKLKGIKI